MSTAGAIQRWTPPGVPSWALLPQKGAMGQIFAATFQLMKNPETFRALRVILAAPPSLTGSYGMRLLTEPKPTEVHWDVLLPILYETAKCRGFLQVLEGKEGKPVYHWDIETTVRACESIDLLVDFVPEGYDLLDLLAHIDWGLWELHKGVVGTLRSLGMFEERWGGEKRKKIAALHHPFSRRAKEVEESCRQLRDGEMQPENLLKDPNLLATLTRLEVECYVLKLFLDRPHWIARLFETSEGNLSHYVEEVAFFRAISEKHLRSTPWHVTALRWMIYLFSWRTS